MTSDLSNDLKNDLISDFQSRFHYRFQNSVLLEQALTHRSFYFENRNHSPGHNERLEFLGDAVLDLCISDELMRLYPHESEGVLSKWRASLVNEASLAEKASRLGIVQILKVGKGELQTQTAARPRLLASAFEALIGAVYQDAGWEPAKKTVIQHFSDSLLDVSASTEFEADYKTRLQERVQREMHRPPDYRIVRTEGPDHNKTFYVEVSVNGNVLATGAGTSRKLAEQQAAQIALAAKLGKSGGEA
jgi:ribonuclease III